MADKTIASIAALPGLDEQAIRADEREKCAKEVPSNWCDALLTGKGAAKIPMDCPGVEKLLLGIKTRIRSRSDGGAS